MAASAVTVALAVSLAACSSPSNGGSKSDVTPKKPTKAIGLTILDGGGDLNGGGKTAIEAFAKANPDLVSGVTYQTAAAPDVTGKLLAQSQGGSMATSLVLGGDDVLGSLETQNLLVSQLTKFKSDLPDFSKIQDDGRANFQKSSDGYGVLINYDQNGPFVEYNADDIQASDVPTTPQALLDWAKAHPGKFSYAQPANSGSGRAFIEALPYMLGDSNPADPTNGWTKTWAYLKQLGSYIKTYPASSTLLAQQYGAGQIDMLPNVVSHDISFRKSKTYPANSSVALFADQQWVTDGHFAMIPKGVNAQTLYVDLKLESYMVSADAQRPRLLAGVLTTANKNMTIDNAGSDVNAFVQQWGRSGFFAKAFATGKVRNPLSPTALQTAFTMWQKDIGSSVG